MQTSNWLLDYFSNKKSTILYLILGVLAFILCINFSQDWHRYEFYNAINAKKFAYLDFYESLSILREPLFHWVSIEASRWLGFSGFVFLATITLLQLKLLYLEKILDGRLIGAFFYICVYLLLFEGTAIRIAYATALIFPALYFIKKQRWVLAVFLILLASLIHFSVILFLLTIPIYFIKKSHIYVYVLVAISVLVAVLDLSVFHLIREILGVINPRYLDYDDSVIKLNHQNSTGLYFYFIAFFGGILLVIKHYLNNQLHSDQFFKTIYLNCMLAISFMCFFHSHVAVGARLGELMLLPVVILLALLHDYYVKAGLHLQRYILVATFFAYFFARFAYLYPSAFRQ